MNMNLQYLKHLPRLLGQVRNFATRTAGWYYTVKFDGIVQVWSEPEMVHLFGELGVALVLNSARPEAGSRAVQAIHLDVMQDRAYVPVALYDLIFRESKRITHDRLTKALNIGRDLTGRYWNDVALPVGRGRTAAPRRCADLLLV